MRNLNSNKTQTVSHHIMEKDRILTIVFISLKIRITHRNSHEKVNFRVEKEKEQTDQRVIQEEPKY